MKEKKKLLPRKVLQEKSKHYNPLYNVTTLQ